MGLLSRLGLVEEKPEAKDDSSNADLSDEEMAKILAEGGSGEKSAKVKPLAPKVGTPLSPVLQQPPGGSISPTTNLTPMEFNQIYEAGKITPPDHGFTVLKVHGMLQAGRLGRMDPRIRGAVVLATLEANAVPVEDVFSDAEARSACLDAYQQFLERKLVTGDDSADREISRLEAELAELMASVKQKIAVLNQEKLNRATVYRSWCEKKAEELARIQSTVQVLKDSEGVGESFDGDPIFNSNPFSK